MRALYGNTNVIRIVSGNNSVIIPAVAKVEYEPVSIEKTNLAGCKIIHIKGYYPTVSFTLLNYKPEDYLTLTSLINIINTKTDMTVYPFYKANETNLVFNNMIISEKIEMENSEFVTLQSLEISLTGRVLLPNIPISFYEDNGYNLGAYDAGGYGL